MDRMTKRPKVIRRAVNWLHILLQYWLTMSILITASEFCVFLFFKTERKCKGKYPSQWRNTNKDNNMVLYHDKWVPVTMAWRVLGLQMEERPPVMEGSCEYIE
jgi:hypothetical protein